MGKHGNRGAEPLELRVLRTLQVRLRSATFGTSACTSYEDYMQRSQKVKARDYSDSESFARDYLLSTLLKKWKGWENGNSQKRSAIEAWIGFERQCTFANERIDRLLYNNRISHLINSIRGTIQEIIGPFPIASEVYRNCRISSGATFDVTRRDARVARKLRHVSSTARCLKHLPLLYGGMPTTDHRGSLSYTNDVMSQWDDPGLFEVEVVRGNRYTTAPKDAATDRSIACEPTLNAFLQQGVGRTFKDRLERVGLSTKDQTRNQSLARFARMMKLATVDLKGASDCLSLSLVKAVMPPAWYELLCDARSPFTYLPGGKKENGRWVKLSKFSSMGNAYTFELETLIFYAIAVAAGGDIVSVYGDDIVIDAGRAGCLIRILKLLGFTTNVDKTFVSGSFYESCGHHFHSDRLVTPRYQKEVCALDSQELIRIHNRLMTWGLAHGTHLVRDALNLIREEWVKTTGLKCPEIPCVERDDGFITLTLTPDSSGDFKCKVLSTRNRFVPWDDDTWDYYYRLRTGSSAHPDQRGWQGEVTPRVDARLVSSRIWRTSVLELDSFR